MDAFDFGSPIMVSTAHQISFGKHTDRHHMIWIVSLDVSGSIVRRSAVMTTLSGVLPLESPIAAEVRFSRFNAVTGEYEGP